MEEHWLWAQEAAQSPWWTADHPVEYHYGQMYSNLHLKSETLPEHWSAANIDSHYVIWRLQCAWKLQKEKARMAKCLYSQGLFSQVPICKTQHAKINFKYFKQDERVCVCGLVWNRTRVARQRSHGARRTGHCHDVCHKKQESSMVSNY